MISSSSIRDGGSSTIPYTTTPSNGFHILRSHFGNYILINMMENYMVRVMVQSRAGSESRHEVPSEALLQNDRG